MRERPLRTGGPGQDALEAARREQAERERGVLELGSDVHHAVAVALLAELERLRTRREGAGRPHGGVDYRPPSRRARLAIAACLNPLEASPPADRILVIRLGAVGDVVRTLPAVSSLRAAYAGAHLSWLVEPAATSAVQGQPWVDEVIVFPRDRLTAALRGGAPGAALRELAGFLRGLRRRRFDLVVDFHGILRSALLGVLSGARRRIGFARPFGRELAWCFATDRAELMPVRISRFERNAELVRYLAVDAPPAPAPLRVDPAQLARVSAELGPGGAPAVIHPGTSDATPYKRYPAEDYARVARGARARGRRALHRERRAGARRPHARAGGGGGVAGSGQPRAGDADAGRSGGAVRREPPLHRLRQRAHARGLAGGDAGGAAARPDRSRRECALERDAVAPGANPDPL